jgi:very-short-patch-repair endonuclease
MMGRIRSSKLSKELRKRQTDAEGRLWYFLRGRNLEGYKFRRQHRLGRYIVDIVCLDKKLVIEVDGGQHNEVSNQEQDTKRTAWLRFWDNEVLTNTEGVLEIIRQKLE